MRPAVPIILDAVLRKLESMTASENDPIKKFEMNFIQIILSLIKRDWDDSAARMVEEIETISNLLNRGAMIAPDSIRRSLTEAVNRAEHDRGDIRLSALDATLDRLQTALIDLHTWLESATGEEEQSLLDDVWSFLVCYTRRRTLLTTMW